MFVIPGYAPSVRDYCATYGTAARCTTGAGGLPNSVLAFPVLFRPALLGGNPSEFSENNSRGSAIGPRKSDSIRVSAVSTSNLTDTITLESSVTYHYYERFIAGTDSFGDLVQNALAGFGGVNCALASPASRAGLTTAQLAAAAGTNGCLYLNPFSTAVASNAVTGQVNPNYAGSRNPAGLSTAPGAGLINSAAVFDSFFVRKRRRPPKPSYSSAISCCQVRPASACRAAKSDSRWAASIVASPTTSITTPTATSICCHVPAQC